MKTIRRFLAFALLLPSLAWATCGTDSYSNTVCSYSPIHYYRMDASSGTSETDVGSSGPNGTYTGTYSQSATSVLAAISDTAVDFTNNAASRIGVTAGGGTTNGPDATNGVGWSAGIWLKMHSNGGVNAFFGRYGNVGTQWLLFEIGGPPLFYVQIYGNACGGGPSGTNTSITGVTTAATNTSYLLIFATVGNGTNIDGELILNGSSEGTFTNKPISTNSTCSQALSIGNVTDDAYKADAVLDEAFMVPSQITTTIATNLYNCGNSGTGCVAGLIQQRRIFQSRNEKHLPRPRTLLARGVAPLVVDEPFFRVEKWNAAAHLIEGQYDSSSRPWISGM